MKVTRRAFLKELEFMSLLVEHGTAAQQILFLQQHLDWLPDLVEEAKRLKNSAFYRNLIGLVEAFVAWDAGRL